VRTSPPCTKPARRLQALNQPSRNTDNLDTAYWAITADRGVLSFCAATSAAPPHRRIRHNVIIALSEPRCVPAGTEVHLSAPPDFRQFTGIHRYVLYTCSLFSPPKAPSKNGRPRTKRQHGTKQTGIPNPCNRFALLLLLLSRAIITIRPLLKLITITLLIRARRKHRR
jgi:hypothetical protein